MPKEFDTKMNKGFSFGSKNEEAKQPKSPKPDRISSSPPKKEIKGENKSNNVFRTISAK